MSRMKTSNEETLRKYEVRSLSRNVSALMRYVALSHLSPDLPNSTGLYDCTVIPSSLISPLHSYTLRHTL